IAAIGAKRGPLWTKAYTGLASLYYSTNTPQARSSFTGILGDMTIGARIGKPVDRDAMLAADLWFYYGGRFGGFLSTTGQPGSEDYLASILEATPGRAEAYFTLGEFTGAAEDYRAALDLDPSRADAYDRLSEWKPAIAAFTDQMNRNSLP